MARDGLFRRQIRTTFTKQGLVYYSTDIADIKQEFVIPFGTNSGSIIGTLKMWNLKATTVGQLAVKDPVLLEAGYRGVGWSAANEPEPILSGEIVSVVTNWSGPDKITTIEIGDSHASWLSRRVNRDWTPGTTVRRVVKDLVADSKLPEGKIRVRDRDNFKFEDGYATAANDTVKSALERVAGELFTLKNAQYEVHVAQGRIHFHHESDLWEHSGVLISAETGMIGQMEVAKREEPVDASTTTPVKFTLKTLLTPKLWADKGFDCKCRLTSGQPRTFKIVSGQHTATLDTVFETSLIVQEAEGGGSASSDTEQVEATPAKTDVPAEDAPADAPDAAADTPTETVVPADDPPEGT